MLESRIAISSRRRGCSSSCGSSGFGCGSSNSVRSSSGGRVRPREKFLDIKKESGDKGYREFMSVCG